MFLVDWQEVIDNIAKDMIVKEKIFFIKVFFYIIFFFAGLSPDGFFISFITERNETKKGVKTS